MEFYQQFVKEAYDADGVLTEFSIQCPAHFNFGYDVVDALAAKDPNKVCMVWCDQEDRERTFTFGEMSKLSNQAANALKAHGIGKGDHVMLMLKRNYEYWYLIVALHKLGAVAIPATHTLMAADIAYRIKAVDVKAVVVTADNSDGPRELEKCGCDSVEKLLIRGQMPGFTDLNAEIEAASDTLERVETWAKEPMLLYFTSGTTGEPKAVMHDHSYALCHILTAKHWQNVRKDGLHLSVSDTGWGKAAWGKLYGQWLCEAPIMVYDYDQFDPRALMDVIMKYKVTTFCAPPTIYRFFVKRGITPGAFDSVKDVVTAGEAMNPEIARRFEAETGLKLREGFGQTESTLMIADLVGQPHRLGTMGRPTPLYHIELRKENGQVAAPGETGEIVVVPPADGAHFGIFMGYCGDDAAYDEVWEGGVYHTRDLATMDENGYITYVSRTDDVIKSCGFRVSPFEVESVLMQHPAVLECAVTGVPDLGRGFRIKATIVLTDGYEGNGNLSRDLQQFVLQNTASYKCPKIFEYVPEMPKTISGKIRRVAIREKDSKQ